MDGVGMDECDLEAEEALARLGVDQLGARVREPAELGADVLDLVGDVVHAGTALREDAADGRVRDERREQLDPAGADEDGRRLDALVLDAGPVLELGAEEALVGRERLVQVVDGDAEMVDAAGDHGPMLTER